MRLLAIPLLAAILAVPAARAQEPKPKADPPKPAEVKLPDGVTKGVTVEGITEYKLKNGLRILLIPDASRPKVTVNCTILVGSRHEGYGETGMAHLLEHMVFKGCPKFPDVPKALRDHGASFNGTTALDRTNYFETMNAGDDNLEFGIELEADRMVNSFIKREDLMSEFTVVRNEFERGENNPVAILYQRMQSAAFEWHNYGKSTIGNRTDIERVPVDRLQAFYKKYYRPENALLTVSGSFDEGKALALAAKHFGPLRNPEEKLPATYTEEPPQDGERVVTLRRVGGTGACGAVYHIPAASHPDFAACEVLATVLGDEATGRLHKALVESKQASAVFALARNTHDPGTLTAIAISEADKTEAARDALIEALENVAKQPVTKEEVERAVRKLVQLRERTLADSQLFAIGISDWAACGDWRLFFLHRDRIEKVTAEDVNKVAAKYLVRSNRTVGVFVPEKASVRAEVPSNPDVAALLKGYTGREAVAAGEAFDPTPENVEKRTTRGEVNGVKYAFLSKKNRGETVVLNMTLRFGSLESLKGQGDAAEFVGPMLMRGTKSKTREQLKDAFDKLHAVVGIGSQAGELSVSVQTKRADLPAVLALLKEVLREPGFPEKEFEIMKREQLDNLNEAKTDPQTLAELALNRKLTPYPSDDVRYVATVEESITRIKATTLEQVKGVYEKQIGGSVGELAVVGDFDPEAVKKAAADLLGGWKSGTKYERIDGKVFTVKGGTEKIETPDKANAVYTAGVVVSIKDTDPDYAALQVGNYLLGVAPLASRLSVKVRGEKGLSYGTGSRFSADAQDASAGRFIVTAITNPVNMGKVDALIGEEVSKFVKEGVSASELEEGKKAYLDSRRVARNNDVLLANQLRSALEAGRTMQYYADLEKQVEKLQPGDVKKAFDKHLKPADLVIIQAGDFKKAGEKKDEKK